MAEELACTAKCSPLTSGGRDGKVQHGPLMTGGKDFVPEQQHSTPHARPLTIRGRNFVLAASSCMTKSRPPSSGGKNFGLEHEDSTPHARPPAVGGQDKRPETPCCSALHRPSVPGGIDIATPTSAPGPWASAWPTESPHPTAPASARSLQAEARSGWVRPPGGPRCVKDVRRGSIAACPTHESSRDRAGSQCRTTEQL